MCVRFDQIKLQIKHQHQCTQIATEGADSAANACTTTIVVHLLPGRLPDGILLTSPDAVPLRVIDIRYLLVGLWTSSRQCICGKEASATLADSCC